MPRHSSHDLYTRNAALVHRRRRRTLSTNAPTLRADRTTFVNILMRRDITGATPLSRSFEPDAADQPRDHYHSLPLFFPSLLRIRNPRSFHR